MDLILAGGHVIDPRSARSGVSDVGFSGNRVAGVAEKLDTSTARKTIDVSGKYVVPGLIDLHTHVYHGGTSLGVDADHLARRAGTTTFVDAGSAGPGNFLGFHDHVIQRSRARILAFLNISFAGIYAHTLRVGECKDLELCDPAVTLDKAREFGDSIIGIKVRVGAYTSAGNGAAPLKLAKQASDALHKPLMSHIDLPPPTIQEVVDTLGPGDILTHCFRPQQNQPFGPAGMIYPEVIGARERGVVFDVGHGLGSLGFETASRMLELGFEPDCISSDVHAESIDGPAYDLLHVMSKFMALGMGLEKVVEKATVAPARAIGHSEIGYLGDGALADATIFHIEEGRFTYVDTIGETISSDSRLVCDGLVIDGTFWDAAET
ncbi:MAG: amidohydrolase/deacetylase family metallohydrolase [Hyphomicrobiales bacterium]|nr:amidohydrolase/deacetylase family metallohydrolase [Hyphomicrobiales bacterium]